MSNYHHTGQSLTSYGGNHGHGGYVQHPTLAPSKSALWRTSPKAAVSPPKVPDNYYNYHNSLYESSTAHVSANADDEDAYYYDDVIVDSNKKSRPVAPRPSKVDEANYEVMTHFGDQEDTSAYPDYPAPGAFPEDFEASRAAAHLTRLQVFHDDDLESFNWKLIRREIQPRSDLERMS